MWSGLRHCLWMSWTKGFWVIGGSSTACKFNNALVARFMGPTWGPFWADRTQVGPMNFVVRVLYSIFACWHHAMETHSALLALCDRTPLATGGFPHKWASYELWRFLCCSLEQAVEQNDGKFPVTDDSVTIMWRQCNELMRARLCCTHCKEGDL